MAYRKPKLRINTTPVSKTITKSAKFISDQHSEVNQATYRNIRIMEAQHSINFLLARTRLMVRRLRSANKAHARFVATGKEDGFIRAAYEWVLDYLVVALTLIWRMIQTTILFFMMLLIRLLLIIVFTAAIFYILYKLITS